MSSPLGFLASNIYLTTRNPKFRTEIEPDCSEDLFFWSSLHLNLGAKFRTEIELLILIKLYKNISPSRNFFNKKLTPMYADIFVKNKLRLRSYAYRDLTLIMNQSNANL